MTWPLGKRVRLGSPPSFVAQLMALPPASMLPCWAMRNTGSSACTARDARTIAVAAHNRILQALPTVASCFFKPVTEPAQGIGLFGIREAPFAIEREGRPKLS